MKPEEIAAAFVAALSFLVFLFAFVQLPVPWAPDWGHDPYQRLAAMMSVANIVLIVLLVYLTFAANRRSSEAVGAAMVANEISRDIGKKQLRAYIHPPEIGIDPGNVRQPVTKAQIKNFGQTPALNLTKKQSISIDVFPITPERLAAARATLSDDGQRISLGPRSSIILNNQQKPTPLTDDQIEHIKAGRMAFYLLMDFEYEDVFGDKHVTRTCSFKNGENFGTTPAMHAAQLGNETE